MNLAISSKKAELVRVAVGAVRHTLRLQGSNPEDYDADAALDALLDLAEDQPQLIAAQAHREMFHDLVMLGTFRSQWERWAEGERARQDQVAMERVYDARDHDAIALPDDPAYIVCRHVEGDSWNNARAYLWFGFAALPPAEQKWPGLLVVVGPRERAPSQCGRLWSGGLLRAPDGVAVDAGYFTNMADARAAIDEHHGWWVPPTKSP